MSIRPLPSRIDPSTVAAVAPPESGKAEVALVTTPFTSPFMPSIQLGLLKALLAESGIAAAVYYLNLPFARDLGYGNLQALADLSLPMLGEWLFGQAAFGKRSDDCEFLERFGGSLFELLRNSHWSLKDLLQIRRELAPQYTDLCAAILPWDRHTVVGFSSTFQQNTAAVALARRIKERAPETCIVFGGANFDYPMELEFLEAFPWIDAAVIGEADDIFPPFIQRVLAGHEPEPGPGLAVRRGSQVLFGGPAPLVDDQQKLPAPDYDDYFYAGGRLKMLDEREHSDKISLTFESSRGCWWGEKNHCTFCGLPPETIKFRTKSAEQVIEELEHLALKHQWRSFYAVDNLMGLRFQKDFCAKLKARKDNLYICYEVKANLTREQMHSLSQAGITTIQPGIESLSSRLLSLMRKGITGLSNVEILKWGRFYSMQVYWHILVGIPGEQAADYAQQTDWIRSIRHLPPPHKINPVRIQRFSPFHLDPGAYGLGTLHPEASYFYIYPPEIDLHRVAYFFDSDEKNLLSEEDYGGLEDEVMQWQRQWRRSGPPPSLNCQSESDRIFIHDARGDDEARRYAYSGPEAALYSLCQTKKSFSQCLNHLAPLWGKSITPVWLDQLMAEMLDRRLMIREGDWVLSLAIPEPHFCN